MIVYLVWRHERYEEAYLDSIYETESAANRQVEHLTSQEESEDVWYGYGSRIVYGG